MRFPESGPEVPQFSECGTDIPEFAHIFEEEVVEHNVENYLRKKGFNSTFIQEVKEMKDKPQRKYTGKVISNALIIHSISPKVYEILRKNQLTYHSLPHQSTLYRRVLKFECQPGIQQEFFKFLKVKLSAGDFWERQCVMMFDEMDLDEKFEYSDRLKRLFKKHKKVQVVLLR